MGTTVVLSRKHKQKRKQRWAYQQYDTRRFTTTPLNLINHANRKRKHRWYHWVGKVCSVNWSDLSYWLSLCLLLQSILSIVLIISIVSIVLILSFSIALSCNLRIIKMNQKILVWPCGVKRGNLSRLLAFTGIFKYFTRSIWEINEIPLGVMTSNPPWGKSFILWNRWGSNILPR